MVEYQGWRLRLSWRTPNYLLPPAMCSVGPMSPLFVASPLKIPKMNFHQILPYVPKGVASILNNNMDKAVFEVSVRDCVANDKSIQFCGPVAGSIQYM